jgi:uncharacterized protein (TIGR03435 family)
MRRVILGLAILAAGVPRVCGQSQPATPLAFEVATIKPLGDIIAIGGRSVPRANLRYDHPPADPLHGVSGNRYSMEIATLTDLTVDAYNVRRDQISGAPGWAGPEGDVYEVNAKAEGQGTLTSDQARQMLQTLLADRFQLKIHRETKNLPAYELTVAKDGPKIKEVPEGVKPSASSATKGLLLAIISNYLDYPLVDKTGLTGERYQVDWDLAEPLEELRQGLKPAPSIFGVVQLQLGLKLEKKSSPTEVLVIDHAEKPSAN